jgi:hypothetical protein
VGFDRQQQATAIKLDCLTLIKALKSTESRSRWEGVIQEIRGASCLLPQCKFQHAKRGCNMAAHKLAQRALITQENAVMRLDIPGDIHSIIEAEAEGNGSTDPCNSSLD